MSDTISKFKITEYEVKKYEVFVELLKMYSDIYYRFTNNLRRHIIAANRIAFSCCLACRL